MAYPESETHAEEPRCKVFRFKDMGLLAMRKEGRKFVFTPVGDIAQKLESGTGTI